MFLWNHCAEVSRGQGTYAEHRGSSDGFSATSACSASSPRARKTSERWDGSAAPTASTTTRLLGGEIWETLLHREHLTLVGTCCLGPRLCSPARGTLFLWSDSLSLKSDFRANVATWKTENLYLQSKCSPGSGSASRTSSWKGTGNKLPLWPPLMGNKKATSRASPWLPQSVAFTLPRTCLPMRAVPVKKEAEAGRKFPVTLPSAKELYSNVRNCSMLFFSQPCKSVAFSFSAPCGLWCCLHPSPRIPSVPWCIHRWSAHSLQSLCLCSLYHCCQPCLQKTILCKILHLTSQSTTHHDNSWLAEVVLGLHSP